MKPDAAAARAAWDAIFADVASSTSYQLSLAESERLGLPRSSETLDLTYGDVEFEALRIGLAAATPPVGGVFVDLGSGSGRAVIAAALLFDLSRCVGIEILEGLHKQSIEAAQRYQKSMEAARQATAIAAVEMRCADIFETEAVQADVVFCCCVSWEPPIMFRLAAKLASELKEGAKVLTVGKPLPAAVELATDKRSSRCTVRFDEVWHGVAQCEWGREPMVVHCMHEVRTTR